MVASPIDHRHERLRRAASAVQHDINNAMMVLSSNLDMLTRSVAEGAPRRQLDRAKQAMQRLEDTMRGFLDAARRPTPDALPISPVVAIQGLLPLLRTVLGARHGLEVALPPRSAAVQLDRARLEVALVALAQEAMEAVPAGARLTLELVDTGAAVTMTLTVPDPLPAELYDLLRAAGPLEVAPGRLVVTWPVA